MSSINSALADMPTTTLSSLQQASILNTTVKDANWSEVAVKALDVWSNSNGVVQIFIALLALFLVLALTNRLSHIMSFITGKKHGKIVLEDGTQYDTADISSTNVVIHELALQITKLTSAVDRMNINITRDQDRIRGMIAQSITTVADLASELRATRMNQQGKNPNYARDVGVPVPEGQNHLAG